MQKTIYIPRRAQTVQEYVGNVLREIHFLANVVLIQIFVTEHSHDLDPNKVEKAKVKNTIKTQ